MQYIKSFSEITKNDVSLAGGKGASLGEMTQAGIPVPPGFVVLAHTFDQFLLETNIGVDVEAILKTVRLDEMHTIEQASEEIQAIIMGLEMPIVMAKEIFTAHQGLGVEFVAVRSSATAEDSSSAAWAGQLNTYLNTTKNDLLEHVKRCWASLFTPRAIFYRHEKGLHTTQVSVAVVVQVMVQSEISGIAFSVHPVTEDYNQMIIEAGYGLGEAIVSGQVTPDSYVVVKDDLSVLDVHVGGQMKMLVKNKEIINKETKGEFNEWVELGDAGKRQKLSEEQIKELAELVKRIEQHYGFPCDIEWAYEGGMFYITQSRPITTLHGSNSGNIQLEKKVDYYLWGRWPELLLYKCFWLKVGAQAHTLLELPISEIKDLKGNYLWRESEFNIGKSIFLRRFQDEQWLWQFFDLADTLTEKILQHEHTEQLEDVFWLASECLSLSEVINLFDHGFMDFISHLSEKERQEIVSAIHPYKNTHIMQLQEDIRNGLNEDELIKRYAWVGTHGFQGSPLTKSKLKEYVVDGQYVHNTSDQSYLVRVGSVLAFYRSYIVETVDKVLFSLIPALSKIANTYGTTLDDMYLLTPNELVRYSGLPFDINERKNAYGVVGTSDGIRVISGTVLEKEYQESLPKPEVANEGVLRGLVAYSGVVRGRVRVIKEKIDLHKVGDGDVLVANETTPDYLPAMKKTVAIVTNLGGITSHAAIVARELKKPCIIGTKIATNVLKDGDMVEVDANNGIVRILNKEFGLETSDILQDDCGQLMSTEEQFIVPRVRDYALNPVYWNSVLQTSDAVNKLYHASVSVEYNIYVNGVMKTVIPKSEWISIGTEVARKMISDTGYFAAIKLSTELAKEEIEDFLKFISTCVIQKMKKEEVVELLQKIYQLFCTYDAASVYAWFVAGDQLKEFIKQKVPISDEDFDLCTFPDSPTAASQMEHDLLSFSLSEHSEEEGAVLLSGRYWWIPFGYDGPTIWNKDYFQEQIRSYRKNIEDTKKQFCEIERRNNERKERIKKIQDHCDFTERQENLIQMLQICTTWTDERKVLEFQLFYYYHQLLSRLVDLYNFPLSFLKFLFLHEIVTLSDLTVDNLKTTAKWRKEHEFMTVAKGGSIRIASDEERTVIKYVIDVQNIGEKNISGTVASRGPESLYRGRVKVLFSSKECNKIDDGEFLVATMTTPEYVPAMKRAVGFITDEGGVTCHAAIVAREMDKPCIISTKIATQILKDGDEVEIDVVSGQIRVISSNHELDRE